MISNDKNNLNNIDMKLGEAGKLADVQNSGKKEENLPNAPSANTNLNSEQKSVEQKNTKQDNKNKNDGITTQKVQDTPQITQDSSQKAEKGKTKMRVRDYIYWALSILLIGLLITCVVLFAVGFRPAVVISPSMKPAIQPGSLVLVKSIEPEKIKVGDVIMFWPTDDGGTKDSDELSVTHRVIEIKVSETGSLTFITHGDANDEGSNETVPASQVIGKIYLDIPWVGVVFLFVKNNLFLVIFGAIAIVCLCYLISMIRKNKKEKQLAEGASVTDNNALDDYLSK